jgi:acetyl-CoA carboxylase biotin carboxylase subunit
MLKRLLIANRGEIAVRIVRACRETGVESVAVYSSVDADAVHVRAADRAVAIGNAPASESYLSIPRIVEAARGAAADAVHPGYGFLSENPKLAEACQTAGLIFVGPSADALSRMGSKIEARKLAASVGVPIVPGETPSDQTDEGIQAAIDRVGLPVVVKASSGGGGKGMRHLRTGDAARDAIQAARREAQAAFGNGTLYVERLIEAPRHVEVQIFADHHGHVVHLGERDCSTQRRHQKVIEESPSPALSPEQRAQMTAAAIAVARAVGYRNAGTVEFLVDGASFYFLEMNTRLQVEHPVTEQVIGVDLVRAQLLVASGDPLPWTQSQLAARGHAIEARVYAEDPSRDFLPQAGTVTGYSAPQFPGIRIDSGIGSGSVIPVYYDPILAKVIATAESRPLAIARLAAALRELRIDGVRTNVGFLIRILELPAFIDGRVDTAFLERKLQTLIQGLPSTTRSPDRQTPHDAVQRRDTRCDPWDAAPSTPQRFATTQNGVAPDDRARQNSADSRITPHQTAALVEVLRAPMPATVIAINVNAGEQVAKGDVLVLLEAMKMELPVRAPRRGLVSAVHCRAGELVDADAMLLEIQ